MGLDTGVRQATTIEILPDLTTEGKQQLTVRVDNDGKDYRAISSLPQGTVVAGVRCTVANFGGRLTVIAVHGTTIPITIEPGRSPSTAPAQDSLIGTAGIVIAEYVPDLGGYHTFSIQTGLYSNAIVYIGFTPWSSASGNSTTVELLSTTLDTVNCSIEINGVAPASNQKLSYFALGW